jgi:hypothetical protein
MSLAMSLFLLTFIVMIPLIIWKTYNEDFD